MSGSWTEVGAARSVVVDVDLRQALRLCAQDPVGSVLAAARIETAIANGSHRGGASLWGFEREGTLVAVCWAGANLVPVCAAQDTDAIDAFARAAIRQGRRCSSIVGPAATVLALWERLQPTWGPAREVRADQPSLVIDHTPWVRPDPNVRLSTLDDLPVLLPACVEMFVEEVGYSPLTGATGAYEARVRSLVVEERSLVRVGTTNGVPEVVFKAELGAVSSRVAQVQGVWVAPQHRGRGLSESGMAAVVAWTLRTTAPVVSLYVNHYNTRALAAYRRVGFREHGTYATILF
ncbi:GNAT family N-acetyltransferase [Actinotalea sp. K2]|uniref:GNAT family N-acetyltransferase n=1 Tax=Actinotalea sp. K2 TaxID=2939438 RepID=UPI0020177403|nr:GNAT family N-acetyltransferase [Actinotalea sp. K2]